MTWPTTACRPVCHCAPATVALPCDLHEAVADGCRACRPAAEAIVLDLRCPVHRAAAEWSASGLAYGHAESPRTAGPRTHCSSGHELTPENTRVLVTGRRACRTCIRASRPGPRRRAAAGSGP